MTSLTTLTNLIVTAHAACSTPSMDNRTCRQCKAALDKAVKLIPELVNEEANQNLTLASKYATIPSG